MRKEELMNTRQIWTEEIKSNNSIFSINFKELWHYRDLLFMLVKRDYLTVYKVAGIEFQPEKYGSFSNRWLTCITINSAITGFTREDVRLALKADNIESRPLWKPMHIQPIFRNEFYYGGKVAEALFENGLCLPSGSNLTDEDFERVFVILDKFFLKDSVILDNSKLIL